MNKKKLSLQAKYWIKEGRQNGGPWSFSCPKKAEKYLNYKSQGV